MMEWLGATLVLLAIGWLSLSICGGGLCAERQTVQAAPGKGKK